MMQTLRYALMNPTGNVTILVETPVPTALQPAAATALMALEPAAEQVGFVSPADGSDVRLRMAGGEFCGNASMSAAVLYGMRNGLSEGRILVEASGTSEPVPVELVSGQDGLWHGTVEMPRPQSIQFRPFPDGGQYPVVAFPGITHVILEQRMPREQAEETALRWCGELGAEALGLMFLEREAGLLTPLVYVPAADTLCWESACGSGMSAVGAWLAWESGVRTTVSLRQPGGVLEVTASPRGPLYLRGTVAFLYEKTATVEL